MFSVLVQCPQLKHPQSCKTNAPQRVQRAFCGNKAQTQSSIHHSKNFGNLTFPEKLQTLLRLFGLRTRVPPRQGVPHYFESQVLAEDEISARLLANGTVPSISLSQNYPGEIRHTSWLFRVC